MPTSQTVLVLGDGGWGTAVALTLHQAGQQVRVWSHDEEYADEVQATRRNPKFLPGVVLPDGILFSGRIDEATPGVTAIFSVIPTQFLRTSLKRIGAALPSNALLVSLSKGIEKDHLVLPSQILKDELGLESVAALSGPSHAEEVSRQLPTTVVVASESQDAAQYFQDLFASTRLRVYSSSDQVGVELGGAVKNVIAIAAGISDGLGFGDNSRAAIVTRGMVEITRLGVALGAKKATFSGLSGIGDLITTCTSQHSRNRAVGFRIGKGERLVDILGSTHTVAEGVETTRSVGQLAERHGVDMPITHEVHSVLYNDKPAVEAVESLMSRELKEE